MTMYNFSSAPPAPWATPGGLLFCLAGGRHQWGAEPCSVILFSMSVAGVARATIISQTVSAWVWSAGPAGEGERPAPPRPAIWVGVGLWARSCASVCLAGLQSTVFSLQCRHPVGGQPFGSIVVAGNSAASNLEGFVYTAMNAFRPGRCHLHEPEHAPAGTTT